MRLTDPDFLCDRCGTQWTGRPSTIPCEGCNAVLCPECGVTRCECGGLFCRGCVHLLEDQDEKVLLCEMCHDVASTCEMCGSAPADLIVNEASSSRQYRSSLWLCARCYLLREKAA